MGIETYFPKLIRAAIEADRRTIENISITIARQLKSSSPEVAKQIADILSYAGVGTSTYRTIGLTPLPKDNDNRQDLVKIIEPCLLEPPIYKKETYEVIKEFILERKMIQKLLADGVFPSRSILLVGEPGVGKTYLAKYLASELDLGLIVLDLALSISSFLGKTGQNLKSVLDYARSQPGILLLDEFDAIGKRRDDPTDLGELKRIVNVLLKELEDWPPHSILIAATNHPELLDKAIWRRFDIVLKIELPDVTTREKLLERYLKGLIPNKQFLTLLAELTVGVSPADLNKLAERVQRKTILCDADPLEVSIKELPNFVANSEKELYKKLCIFAKQNMDVSLRTIASWIGKSPSTVHNYLKEEQNE